ncbi:MAG: hypothetical protein AB7O62_26660, partial [Pirellulales bacterium]
MRSFQPMPQRRGFRGIAPVFPALLAVLSLALLTGGGWILYRQLSGGGPAAYQTPVGVLLMVLALVQAKIAWTAWWKGTAATLQLPRQPLFWRYQASGPVVCYLVSLLQGPGERALF